MVRVVPLGGWDVLLNLIPFVGPAVYGAKKGVEELKDYADDGPSAKDCENKGIYGLERLLCVMRAQGKSEAQITQRLALESQYKLPTAASAPDPWYVTYRNYLYAAGGLAALALVVGLARR